MPKKLFYCHWCDEPFYDYASQRSPERKDFCGLVCKRAWNRTLPGYWKGKKMSAKARQNMSKNHADFKGSKNGRWKGGKRIDKDGYVLIWCPEHNYADGDGYIREHRLVMEKHLGRLLDPKEVIHHVDKNKQNNSLKNLRLFNNTGEHTKHEWKIGSYNKKRQHKKTT